MRNRLQIGPQGIADMVRGLREVAALEDPVGEVNEMSNRPSGITVGRMRVPVEQVLCLLQRLFQGNDLLLDGRPPMSSLEVGAHGEPVPRQKEDHSIGRGIGDT